MEGDVPIRARRAAPDFVRRLGRTWCRGRAPRVFGVIVVMAAMAPYTMRQEVRASTTAGYYVWDGQRLVERRNGDTQSVSGVLEWQVWLYTTRDRHRWGIISGPTAAKVIERRRHHQEQDEKANRRCDCPPSDLTYSDYLGPIAVIKHKPGTTQRVLNQIAGLRKLQANVGRLRELYAIAEGNAEGPNRAYLPAYQVGMVLKEYATTVQRASRNVMRARELVERAEAGTAGELQAAIHGLQGDFSRSATYARKLRDWDLSATVQRIATAPPPFPRAPAVPGTRPVPRVSPPVMHPEGRYSSTTHADLALHFRNRDGRAVAELSWRPREAMPGVLEVRQSCTVDAGQVAEIVVTCGATRVRASIVLNDGPGEEYDASAVTMRLRRRLDGSLSGTVNSSTDVWNVSFAAPRH
jgi:hypothetical protein